VKQVWLILLSLIVLTIGAVSFVQRRIDPPVETIVATALKSVKEQNRLSAFAARFVTVSTSSKARFGLSAEKTLIIPAMVRYEVDLARVKPADLVWNSKAKSLTIKLPPIELSGPEFDLPATREYQSGAVLLTLTDVEKLLDTENRAKAKADILAQAGAPTMLKLARDATIRSVASNFALPLRAAGIEAKVEVEIKQ
jgi:Protein of unknown function (DUF4230)